MATSDSRADDPTPWFARSSENRPNAIRPTPTMLTWMSRTTGRLTNQEPWVYAEGAQARASRAAGGNRGARSTERTRREDADPRAVPPEVSERLVRVGSDYYLANGTHALKDRGSKILVKSDNTEVIRSAVLIAPERGWSDITVTGSKAFRRQAWREGTAIGLIVRGYNPTEFEKAQFVRARAQERLAATSSGSSAATTASTAPSSDGRARPTEPATSKTARRPQNTEPKGAEPPTPRATAASPANEGSPRRGNGQKAPPPPAAAPATARQGKNSPGATALQETLELSLRDPQAAARYVRTQRPDWANAVLTTYAAAAFARQLQDEADRQAFVGLIIADLQRSQRARESIPAPRLRERAPPRREEPRAAEPPRGRSSPELS